MGGTCGTQGVGKWYVILDGEVEWRGEFGRTNA